MKSPNKNIVRLPTGTIDPNNFWHVVWYFLPRFRTEFVKEMVKISGGLKNVTEIQRILFLAVKIEYPKFDKLMTTHNLSIEMCGKKYIYDLEVI